MLVGKLVLHLYKQIIKLKIKLEFLTYPGHFKVHGIFPHDPKVKIHLESAYTVYNYSL